MWTVKLSAYHIVTPDKPNSNLQQEENNVKFHHKSYYKIHKGNQHDY